jgi:hypothetical protein
MGARRSAAAFAPPRILVACCVILAFALAFVLTPQRGPRSMRRFDADRLASLEVGMWQAYYGKARVRLLQESYRELRDALATANA